MQMCLKKTSWYSFIYPMRVGALVARPAQLRAEQFCRLGWYFGAAFQIQDDILNLTGDYQKYGKEIAGDLWEGKRTLMLIHLLKQCSARERTRLRRFLARSLARNAAAEEVEWVYWTAVALQEHRVCPPHRTPTGRSCVARSSGGLSRAAGFGGEALHPRNDPLRRGSRPLAQRAPWRSSHCTCGRVSLLHGTGRDSQRAVRFNSSTLS